MNAIKYIGMDVHLAKTSIAVLDANGKLTMEVTVGTQAGALRDFIRGVSGTLNVTFEEGTLAHWLYTVLGPHVAKLVVCDPRQNPRRRGEKKSDRLDARKLAELLRLGSLKPVYHGNALGPALQELARSYTCCCRCARRHAQRCWPRVASIPRTKFCAAFPRSVQCAWPC